MTVVLIGLLGGFLTGISPCILPVLPIIFLGSGVPGADPTSRAVRWRPFLVVLGLTLSFALFTLLGSLVLSLLNLPDDLIRWIGLAALALIGLSLLIPPLERLLERPFALIPQREVNSRRGGLVLGLALGAVFVPCAGPVLAAITVAGATGEIGAGTIALTVSFAIGCAVPLLFFALAGQRVVTRVQAFRRRQRVIRVVSGAVMIALAGALAFNITDVVQRYIPNYTQTIADGLQSSVGAALSGISGTGTSGDALTLSDCQTAAYFGGSAIEDCGVAPELAGISGWLNTSDEDLTLESLQGKVVLVDFWAYSCINCQRELAHVEAWYEAYASDDFVVIGVHTPEYAFEHDASNIAAGADRLGLTFPIAIDNDYATWSAYNNSSWPASYLIDADGNVRYVSVGEGDYSEQEAAIRQLLEAANPDVDLAAATDVADTTPQDTQQTPESYLGTERADNHEGSGDYTDGTHEFSFPSSLGSDSYALDGTWTLDAEKITAEDDASIELSYHATNVYLDVGGTGTLTVTANGVTSEIEVSGAPNIYTVASNASATSGEVTIALSDGLEAYSFTFG